MMKKEITVLAILLVVALLFLISSSSMFKIVYDDQYNHIYVDPIRSSHLPTGQFTLDIECAPLEPIRSWELSFSFDPSVVHVDSVVEGDFFDGANNGTFFNPGIIDNTAGTVTQIFSLPIGNDWAYDHGVLITVTFTPQQDVSQCMIDIYDAGVTDDAMYLDLVVSDGNIGIETMAVGDMNSNGNTDSADVRYLALWLLNFPGYETMTLDPDTNGNGDTNSADVRYLAMWYLGAPDYEILNPQYYSTYNI